MTVLGLATKWLLHNWSRTLLTYLAVTAAFVLLGTLGAIGQAFEESISRASDADLRTNARFGSVPVPYTHARDIASLEGVGGVSGRNGLYANFQTPANFVFVMGVDENFFDVRTLTGARPDLIAELQQRPNAAFASAAIAKKYSWRAGDRVNLESTTIRRDGSRIWQFEVIGIVDYPDNPNKDEFLLSNYRHIDDERVSGKGSAFEFFIKLVPGADPVQVATEIDAYFANSSAPTRSASEKVIKQRAIAAFGDLNFLIITISGAAFFMVIMIVATTIYHTISERMAEIATLEAIGFERTELMCLVFFEVLVQTLLGALSGLGLSIILMPLIQGLPVNPSLTPLVLFGAVGSAIFVATASVVLPMLRLHTNQIAFVLRGK